MCMGPTKHNCNLRITLYIGLFKYIVHGNKLLIEV